MVVDFAELVAMLPVSKQPTHGAMNSWIRIVFVPAPQQRHNLRQGIGRETAKRKDKRPASRGLRFLLDPRLQQLGIHTRSPKALDQETSKRAIRRLDQV